jgi:hypothetical protein
MKTVRKAVAAALSGAIGWGMAVTASASGPVTASEWMALATAAVTAFLVWLLPNEAE